MTTDPKSLRVAVMIGCLGLIAGLAALWPVYRAFLKIEIDLNEGWNAYFADAAMGRMPLYPTRDKLITNNYPPLSFYCVGALGWLLGDPVLAGRLLSLGAVAVIAAGVALAIRRLGANSLAAGIGAMYWVATMGCFFPAYFGMNDPHLLAQAVMTIGFVVFLRALERDRGYWVAFLLMVVAGFIKHNLAALPLTAMIWLGIHRPRQLAKSGLLAAAAIAAGFALCYAAFGADFFANMLSARTMQWRRSISSMGHLQWVAVGLFVWVYVGIAGRADPRVQLCSLMIGTALVMFCVQKAGAGVAENAQFELVFAVSVAVGLAFKLTPDLPMARRFSPVALQFAFLLAICLRLVVPPRLEPVRLLVDGDFRAEIASRERAMSATVARIRATPGDVGCCMLACFWAGKPFVLDSFNTGQRMLAGNLSADAIARRVANGELTLVQEDRLLTWSAEPGPAGDVKK